MGTKSNPGDFDCYAKALPDEPMFILLARDPMAPIVVREWAADREAKVRIGTHPVSDFKKAVMARICAANMVAWRAKNEGRWLDANPFEDQFTHARDTFSTPERIGAVSATTKAPPRPNLAPGIWVHYKFGSVYELLNLALNEGTGEWMVVHMNRRTMNIFVRPASEWTQMVDTVGGGRVPRFREPDAVPSKGLG